MNVFKSEVKEISLKGDGIVFDDEGLEYKVPGVWIGDIGEFRVIKKSKNLNLACLENLITSSKDRIEAPCSYQGFDQNHCGGCPWMMIDYQAQLDQKNLMVQKVLVQSKIIESNKIKKIIPSEKIYHYRNRANLKTDGNKIGFLSGQTNEIIDIKKCEILNKENNSLLKKLRSYLPNTDWLVEKNFDWNFLETNDELKINQVIVNFKQDFKQANSAQNEVMKNWLDSHLQLEDLSSTLIELFAGSGNFTQNISQIGFNKIIAIESENQSIKKLEKLNLENVFSFKKDLYLVKDFQIKNVKNTEPSILILDPPRSGFSRIDEFLNYYQEIKTIYYISCDLTTFRNDSKKILEKGFQVEEIQPIDQFPHTPHIELMGLFRK